MFLRQVGALLGMNLLGIPQRLGLVCTTVIGVTCAVGVLVAMLAMGVGARRQALGDVRPDRVILLSKDALEPGQSNIPQSTAVLIPNLAGIRRDSRGNPIVVPEARIFVWAREKASGTGVGFPITGAGAELTEYTPELHLTSGRMFRRGLRELIASNYCARVYHDFSVGDARVIDGKDWHVVGNFNLGRGDGTCTVYADVDTVLSTFGRNDYNQVNVMLQSPSAFDELVHAIAASPSLQIRAEREAALAKADFAPVNGILNFVSYFIGTILAVAATIGAANSLYAVVDGRRRELATVRAVGFRGVPLIIATLIEAVLMALPGALIGVGLAWVFFNDRTASPFGFRFHLAITPSLALLGVGWSLAIGLIAGLLPAARAARIPVTVALRAT
ncbi:MAG: ABC transporter permease [Steroidobacteraceae bacterium]